MNMEYEMTQFKKMVESVKKYKLDFCKKDYWILMKIYNRKLYAKVKIQKQKKRKQKKQKALSKWNPAQIVFNDVFIRKLIFNHFVTGPSGFWKKQMAKINKGFKQVEKITDFQFEDGVMFNLQIKDEFDVRCNKNAKCNKIAKKLEIITDWPIISHMPYDLLLHMEWYEEKVHMPRWYWESDEEYERTVRPEYSYHRHKNDYHHN